MTVDAAHPEPAAAPPSRSPAVPLLLAVQLLTGIVLAPAITFFPVYLKELGLSAVLISGIVTIQRVMALGSSLVGGKMVDTIGAKRTLVAGQVLYFAATLLFLARSTWWIALVWAVCGIGMGPASLGGTSYLIEKADHARLGLFTALLYWGTTLGGAIGNPLAAALLGRTDWRGLVPFTALPAVGIVLATAIALPRSARRGPLLRAPRRDPGGDRADRREPTGPPARVDALPPHHLLRHAARVRAAAPEGRRRLHRDDRALRHGEQRVRFPRAARRGTDRRPYRLEGADRGEPTPLLAAASFVIAAFPNALWVVFAGATVAMSAAWSLSTLLPTQMTKAVEPSGVGRALGYIHLFWNLAMILAGLTGGVLFEAWNGLPLLIGGIAAAAGLPLAAGFARMTASEPSSARAVSGSSRLRSGGHDGA